MPAIRSHASSSTRPVCVVLLGAPVCVQAVAPGVARRRRARIWVGSIRNRQLIPA